MGATRQDFAHARTEGARWTDRVWSAWEKARSGDGEGVFTAVVPQARIAAEIARVADAGASRLPLAGLAFSVKDNIHVAGMLTTCNCTAIAIEPSASATVVQKLEAAGAILIGKNTLDQFATGLNGTRTLGPLCRNAVDPAYIPGGSSSGSAVVVAKGIVDFALGTDTGGSGRVPGACNGLVGLKPTLGVVSTTGLVYNSRYLDAVPVFANACADAYEILHVLAGPDPSDVFMRPDAASLDLRAHLPEGPVRIAVPRRSQLDFHEDDIAAHAFARDLEALAGVVDEVVEIDFAFFQEAGRHVFEGAMLAERALTYGDVVREHPQAVHPAVRAAIEPGLRYTAVDAFHALYELRAQRHEVARRLAGFAGLVVPTVPTIFTIEAMQADPVRLNSVMGTYTYFANPLDLCAVSVPGFGRRDGLPSALCFNGLPMRDGGIRALAERFERLCRG